MSQTNAALREPTPDPRHTFLATKDVFTRYKWKRTKGYKMLRSEGFPSDLYGAYRLDLLMAWEDQGLAGPRTDPTATRPPTDTGPTQSAAPQPSAPGAGPVAPARRRSRGVRKDEH